MRVFQVEAVVTQVAAIFSACGLPPEDALVGARVLVRSDARGHHTHGVSRVESYVARLKAGDLNPRPTIRVSEVAGTLLVDGDAGLGQVVGTRAADVAGDRASTAGSVVCRIRNSGHLGAIGMFNLVLAERGFVSILTQATPATIAPLGATRPLVGNNPIAFGSPGPEHPVLLDMALSVSSRGDILAAAREGHAIASGLAVGPDGQPTTDPDQAIAGWLLPAAGHKGFGLAIASHILAAVLTETTGLSQPVSVTGGGSGHVAAFLLVVNPELLVGRDLYDELMTEWITSLRGAPGQQVRIPGDEAARLEATRNVEGIAISDATAASLRQAADAAGAEWNLAPLGT